MTVSRSFTMAIAVSAALAWAVPARALAQAIPAPTPPATQSPSSPGPTSSSVGVFLKRWLELQNATLNLRYRFVDNSARVVTTNQLQHRETLRGRVKFDRGAHYALNFGIFTGVRFTSSWDNTGWGIGDAQKNVAFKALYVAAQPVAGLEGQVGGLYIIRGESTEFTTYDDDGYVMGERVSVRRPKQLFFDEVSFTNAYLVSDPTKIPVSKRFSQIDEPNYRHVLVDKKLGKRAGVSADYTTVGGARTWRQAINLKLPKARAVDAIIFENYERTNRTSAYGFTLAAEKALNAHLSINGGYARIDPQYGGLNADRFNIGNRAFVMGTYAFSPEFTASAFVTTAVGHNGVLPQRTLSNIVFSYNALPGLKRTGLF